MKRVIALLCLAVTVVIMAGWLSRPAGAKQEKTPELIRFHVRANSDSEEDQALKLKVRDGILTKFSPILGGTQSLEESRQLVKQNLTAMEKEAAKVIAAEGKSYPVRAEYGFFEFPLKSYGDFVLQAGRYEAVQVLIGEAKGKNWWCVLFPPLCFVDINTSLAQEPIGLKIANDSEQTQKREQEIKPLVKFRAVEVIKNFLHWQ